MGLIEIQWSIQDNAWVVSVDGAALWLCPDWDDAMLAADEASDALCWAEVVIHG